MRAPFALAFAAALAGCLAPAAAPEVGVPAPEGLLLSECIDVTGRFPRPRDALAAQLPAGFEPAPYRDLAPMGQVWIMAAECATLAGAAQAERPRVLLQAIQVEAPDEFVPEEARGLMFVLDVLVTSEPWGEALRLWGQANAEAGEIAFSLETAPARRGRAEARGLVFEVDAVPAAQPTSIEPDFFRFFLGDARGVTGAIDWRTTEGVAQTSVARLSDGSAGSGGHFWGDGYDYDLRHVPLERLALEDPYTQPRER